MKRLLPIFLGFFLALQAYAIDLSTAIKMTLDNYPSIRALEAERIAIRGRSELYRSFLNPSVGILLGNFGSSKERFSKAPVYSFSYSQPLALDLRDYFRKVAQYQNVALDYRLQAERNRLTGEVMALFYEALYRKEMVKLAEESLKISQDIYNFVKRLYELGETTKLEFFRAERELLQSQRELQMARSEYLSSLQILSHYVGVEVKDVEGDLFQTARFPSLDINRVPVVAEYDALLEAVKAQRNLEMRLAKPIWSLEVVGEKVGDTTYGYRVGVSSPLPVFYRREGELLQLQAREEALRREKELILRRIEQEYNASRILYESYLKQIDNIEKKDLPVAEEELALALKSYRLKVITLLELSDAKRRYLQTKKQRLDLFLALHREVAKITSIGGM
ncbi:outer membrane efflux protein [Thermocrinis albus DSM 14484]|uniref:Outer membrane efflux protein n=1 Tax=Thermocrinis albus (strain DSM 14484 / JCM 11386 / HI 11/12) TaxID=638303 RepID=D3SQH3_THEAH|nr:TolC family protein [Thermocrinis albus]ADC89410.1 outer membrane efflux protein [Thermocrinis albus DSM 14484]